MTVEQILDHIWPKCPPWPAEPGFACEGGKLHISLLNSVLFCKPIYQLNVMGMADRHSFSVFERRFLQDAYLECLCLNKSSVRTLALSKILSSNPAHS